MSCRHGRVSGGTRQEPCNRGESWTCRDCRRAWLSTMPAASEWCTSKRRASRLAATRERTCSWPEPVSPVVSFVFDSVADQARGRREKGGPHSYRSATIGLTEAAAGGNQACADRHHRDAAECRRE